MRTAKSHKSAVCVIPPLAVQHAIQRIRCRYDKGFVRWPPHINLLYPFLDNLTSEAAAAAAAAATGALAHLAPFKVHLGSLSYFEHSSSYTLWMDAADRSGLQQLQGALQAAFPGCKDLSDDPDRGITSFTPHLSLGQWHNKQQLLAAMQEYASDSELKRLLHFDVTEVCILTRQGYRDPFTVRYAVPLGTSTSSSPYPQPQQVDVPYVATTSSNLPEVLGLSDAPADRLRFGLGASSYGLWNFAYGANMRPAKLGGSRGLHPAASQPAVLTGYRLAFNHRGGFGNLMKVQQQGLEAAERDGDSSNGGSSGGEVHSVPPGEVHGVLHQVSPADMADLMCMEHEYQPQVVMVQPYGAQQQQQPEKGPAIAAEQQQQQPREVTMAAACAVQNISATQGQQQPHLSSSGQCGLVPSIAFVSPRERLIAEGLPPTRRYLSLLQEGAQHWQLDAQYTSWLQHHPAIEVPHDRGAEYYTGLEGQHLPVWPKIRTGGSQQQNSRKQGNRAGGRGARGGRKRGLTV